MKTFHRIISNITLAALSLIWVLVMSIVIVFDKKEKHK